MNLQTASLFLSGIASLSLGLFAYFKGKKTPTCIALSFFTFSIAVWCLGQAFGAIAIRKEIVLFWTRVNTEGAIFIPLLFLIFVLTFLNKFQRQKSTVYIISSITFLFLLTNLTPLFVKDIAPKPFIKFYPVPGPAYLYFVSFLFVVALYVFFLLFNGIKESKGQKRNQIIYVTLASLVGFTGGTTAFFPIFNIPFPPLAHIFMPLYIVFALYAILKHHLLDINVVIRKSIIYSVLTMLFTGIYILIILIFKDFLQTLTGIRSFLFTCGFVFGFIILFEPVRDRIQKIVDDIFYKRKYDYQKTIKDLSQAAVTIFDENKLLDLVKNTILEKMKISNITIVLDPTKTVPSECEISLPLKFKEQNLGFICLGPKLSGDFYTEEDIDLLTTLSNQIAVALENATLYRQVLYADKLASLGTMAAGMAHEIKNPLASIKGMTQILKDNLNDQVFIDKYQEIVVRQLDRINSIVETLLKIGKPKSLLIQKVDIGKIIKEVIELFKNRLQKHHIKLNVQIPPSIYIYGDREQLTQAIINLVLNGIQVMEDGGELFVKVSSISDKVIIIIKDSGIGIPAENLKNIFDPFFTTKKKGSGLGLSVTYRIISQHRGKINVESTIGKGTVFEITLSKECLKDKCHITGQKA